MNSSYFELGFIKEATSPAVDPFCFAGFLSVLKQGSMFEIPLPPKIEDESQKVPGISVPITPDNTDPFLPSSAASKTMQNQAPTPQMIPGGGGISTPPPAASGAKPSKPPAGAFGGPVMSGGGGNDYGF